MKANYKSIIEHLEDAIKEYEEYNDTENAEKCKQRIKELKEKGYYIPPKTERK